MDAVCQEGVFVVENVSFYNDTKLATELTAEADWKRRGLYIGPQVCLSRFVTLESAFSIPPPVRDPRPQPSGRI
jgi:hypothetical protein